MKDTVAAGAAKAAGIQGNIRGDGFVLGGQILVNTNGEVVFEHKQKRYGDDATFKDLAGAILEHFYVGSNLTIDFLTTASVEQVARELLAEQISRETKNDTAPQQSL